MARFNKSVWIQVRVTRRELADFKGLAKKRHLPLATLVRQLLYAAFEEVDSQKAQAA